MSINNPQGEEKYWFNGLPFEVLRFDNPANGEKYWFNGLPLDFLMPAEIQKSFFMMF